MQLNNTRREMMKLLGSECEGIVCVRQACIGNPIDMQLVAKVCGVSAEWKERVVSFVQSIRQRCACNPDDFPNDTFYDRDLPLVIFAMMETRPDHPNVTVPELENLIQKLAEI